MSLPSARVVYISPRGKRCMLVPYGAGGRPWLYFRYLSDVSLSGDGFTLTLANFRLMREAPEQQLERGNAAAR